MRIRTIKPEFWTHRELGRLPDFTQLAALALLNYSDDEGYFEANPLLIRGALFPLREDYRNITVALRELIEIGYIEILKTTPPSPLYVGRVVKFAEHQVINHAKPSKLKSYCDYGNVTVMLPYDYYQEWKGKEGNGTGKGKDLSLARSARCTHPGFPEFYAAYPRKESRIDAEKAWEKHKPPLDECLKAIARAKSTPQWQDDGGRFIPCPARFINNHKWTDNGIEMPKEQPFRVHVID